MIGYLKLLMRSSLMGVLLMASVSTFAVHDHNPESSETRWMGGMFMATFSAATAVALIYSGDAEALSYGVGAAAWFALRFLIDPTRKSDNKLVLAGDALGICGFAAGLKAFL